MSKSPAVIKITTGMRGPKGEAFVASLGTLALSAAAPTVPALANVNEWVVTGTVQVQLPADVVAGSQFTVHVQSGYQGIIWPNGTTVYGATDASEVWVTLLRAETGWVVLIPSGGAGSGLIDTGWTTVLNAANIGAGLQFTAGDASMVAAGWTLNPVSFGGAAIRRSGNLLLVSITGGWVKSSGTGTSLFSLPLPTGLVHDANGSTCLNTATVGGVKVAQAYTYLADDLAGKLTISLSPTVPAGVAVSTQGPLMFPIAPASTWGD